MKVTSQFCSEEITLQKVEAVEGGMKHRAVCVSNCVLAFLP